MDDTPQLSYSDALVQSEIHEALSDPIRLQILSLLSTHHGTLIVSELVLHTGIAQPVISHHLKVLREAGLIRKEYERRDGRKAYYAIEVHVLMQAHEALGKLVPRGRKEKTA